MKTIPKRFQKRNSFSGNWSTISWELRILTHMRLPPQMKTPLELDLDQIDCLWDELEGPRILPWPYWIIPVILTIGEYQSEIGYAFQRVGPIYEMTKIRNETKWSIFARNPKYKKEKSNLWNELIFNYNIHISNLRNGTCNKCFNFRKCPIYEMDKIKVWTSKKVQLTKWTVAKVQVHINFQTLQSTKWTNLLRDSMKMSYLQALNFWKFPIYEMAQSPQLWISEIVQ